MVPLGACGSAVFFDRPAGDGGRLWAEQDGKALPRPFMGAALPLRSGGVRQVLVVPQGAQALLARHLMLRVGDMAVAEVDPAWLQLPLAELPALTGGLSAEGTARLLRMMLTAGASLFGGSPQVELTDALCRLLDLCAIPTIPLLARTDIGGWILASYGLPTGSARPADAMAILNGRLVRLPATRAFAENDQLHVLLHPGQVQAQIVVPGPAPARLAAAGLAPLRQPLRVWLQSRSKPCRDWLFAGLDGETAAALTRELADDAVDPTVTVGHLSRLPAGLLYLLHLHDPSRLVRTVVLAGAGQRVPLAPATGADGTALLVGLADLAEGADQESPFRIEGVCHSGRTKVLAQVPVASFDGTIPTGFAEAWKSGAKILEPLARARVTLRRDMAPTAVQHFGAGGNCGLRIVTPISDSADLIRARAALILAEAPAARVEVVCTIAEGSLAAAAYQILDLATAIYGVPHRLVLLPPAATAGHHLRAALAEARDTPVLILGADVLPAEAGWLSFWRRRLRRQTAIAPVLLAADGSIAATCEGEDPSRGLSVGQLPSQGRRIDRPLPDCLALAPAGLKRLLDAPAHPDPAVWIARCLAGVRSEHRFPFRRFGQAPARDALSAAMAEADFALIGRSRS